MGKPATEITNFDPWSFKPAMVYHLIYHYSFGLHINHMIFLFTYILGILLAMSAGGWILTALGTSLLIMYAMYVVKDMSIPFMFIVIGLNYLVRVIDEGYFMQDEGSTNKLLTALAICLGSFFVQIAGHIVFEDYQAPPSLMHGFVAAPVLETVSLQFRLGCFKERRKEVYDEVDAVRFRASNNYLLRKT